MLVLRAYYKIILKKKNICIHFTLLINKIKIVTIRSKSVGSSNTNFDAEPSPPYSNISIT